MQQKLYVKNVVNIVSELLFEMYKGDPLRRERKNSTEIIWKYVV